jgi:hypothetical protein
MIRVLGPRPALSLLLTANLHFQPFFKTFPPFNFLTISLLFSFHFSSLFLSFVSFLQEHMERAQEGEGISGGEGENGGSSSAAQGIRVPGMESPLPTALVAGLFPPEMSSQDMLAQINNDADTQTMLRDFVKKLLQSIQQHVGSLSAMPGSGGMPDMVEIRVQMAPMPPGHHIGPHGLPEPNNPNTATVQQQQSPQQQQPPMPGFGAFLRGFRRKSDQPTDGSGSSSSSSSSSEGGQVGGSAASEPPTSTPEAISRLRGRPRLSGLSGSGGRARTSPAGRQVANPNPNPNPDHSLLLPSLEE